MSLGKRARPPMKRTTSITEFSLDLINGGADRLSPPLDPPHHNPFNGGFSPKPHHRNSPEYCAEPAHFLRACSLCQRRLIPGRDIYMYRGDRAFCSLECRQHQMTKDERKEKRNSLVMEVATTAAAVNHISAAAETVAAAV